MTPEPSPHSDPSGAPPTMEDVARAVGLHRTTVSLALRNHPRIPEATRTRVKDAAASLGYRPHPLVSALMTYRANHRKPTWRGTLGLITSGSESTSWSLSAAYRLMHAGALARAHELGYDLQPFWAYDPALPVARFNTMLRTRNVPGVIVAPLLAPAPLPPLEWQRLSAVAIGFSLREPELHRVTNDYFHSMITAVTHTLKAGRRRIGLMLDRGINARVDHLWLSAYLMQQRIQPDMEPLEPLLPAHGLTPELLRAWLERERPDAIISLPGSRIREQITALGYRVPEEIAWISLGCYDRSGADAGIFQNYELIGQAAVDFLIGMINRGERGIPEQSYTLQIKGMWVDGASLSSGL